MKRFQILSPGALAGVCVLASAAWVAAGPVTYQSQSRTLRAELNEVFELGEDEFFSAEDSATAPDFADWDATVAAEIDNPPTDLSPWGVSSISQRSSLSDGGITAGGVGRGLTSTFDGSYAFETTLDVTFTLDEARAFRLDYARDFGDLFNRDDTIRLTTADGGTVIFDEPRDSNDMAGSRTGELGPGQYRFVFEFGVRSDEDSSIPYSVSLALNPVDGPGPTPNPIPLPPAAWSGLATVGALAVLRLRRGLRSRAGRPS